ncbi:ABC-type spermidine/putrescine transport system, ATPase component [Rubellimicrobium thermophilum DSM 16684]|uniref:ABC-type spermidine/putrescine transport system, ATPase component n=1 Tax=Rubellimicrobium thermophilum DSM 16684 TaxID=1123069 RepID=S9QST9_9RHOB|nr:ABC-type spermidine/putrescine transport system, ATPase component [Rubellimicrobium thermophilum DSM 16684]
MRALDGVTLAIGRGEFFTLLGPSGCGKTTLLRCIAGFETPDSGRILLDGRDITQDPPHRRRVNTVFQSYALFPPSDRRPDIAFGLEMLGRPRAEVQERVARMLALVQLEALADRRPEALSGGQQQRVALARALAPQPAVLLLDEPLSALDRKLRREMQSELKRLQTETGITFVFVTHDQEEALAMSDRVGVMAEGRLLQVGTPRDIYDRPATRFVADFIGETNFLPAMAGDGLVRLRSGEVVAASPLAGPVTVAIRPEQIRLVPAEEEGVLAATLEGATYLGTDSLLRLRLRDGSSVIARLPSVPGTDAAPPPGSLVGLRPVPGAVQVLAE